MAEPGATWSAYDPPAGTDPTWDAFVAAYTAKAATANADAERQRTALDTEYNAGVASLDFQAPGQRRDLEASLLQRGVGRSSQAIRRRGELEGEFLSRRNAADTARQEGKDSIDSALLRELTGYAAEREAQIAASRLRLLEKDKAVPSVDVPGGATLPGTGGSTTSPGGSSGGGGQRSSRTSASPADTKPKGSTKPAPDYRGYASQWTAPPKSAGKTKTAQNRPMLPRVPAPYKVTRS